MEIISSFLNSFKFLFDINCLGVNPEREREHVTSTSETTLSTLLNGTFFYCCFYNYQSHSSCLKSLFFRRIRCAGYHSTMPAISSRGRK